VHPGVAAEGVTEDRSRLRARGDDGGVTLVQAFEQERDGGGDQLVVVAEEQGVVRVALGGHVPPSASC
jgi:hypothetical protein